MHMRDVVAFLSQFYEYCRYSNCSRYYTENPRPNEFKVTMEKDYVKYTIHMYISPSIISTETKYGGANVSRTINFRNNDFDEVMNQMLEDARYLRGKKIVND